ncbi:hypothetical protein HX882_13925 [Pseudomonas gingeri]|uniref:Uncharacterized protein n=1 Tax=Pseudomonas gingeri TaxID=117681 RepID=A0A7Y8C2V0_9PSED|nr:hypothetical protein [Pseudomonas gingeri]NWB96994.1 hypothetical protein [Pseudomonas gingeri]
MAQPEQRREFEPSSKRPKGDRPDTRLVDICNTPAIQQGRTAFAPCDLPDATEKF